MKLNPAFKKKWLKALRSGEYEQGQGCLVNDKDQFCCLGVACNLVVDEGVGEWRKEGDDWTFNTKTESDCMYLPREVRERALHDGDHFTWANDWSAEELRLAALNDNGESFEVISDYIEANL